MTAKITIHDHTKDEFGNDIIQTRKGYYYQIPLVKSRTGITAIQSQEYERDMRALELVYGVGK